MQRPLVTSDPHAEADVGPGDATGVLRPPRPGVPRWVRWVTYGAVLAPLPSAVWRLGLAAGLSMGFSPERLHALDVPGWASLYVAGLSVVSMGLALLALGLIRRWGRTSPTGSRCWAAGGCRRWPRSSPPGWRPSC